MHLKCNSGIPTNDFKWPGCWILRDTITTRHYKCYCTKFMMFPDRKKSQAFRQFNLKLPSLNSKSEQLKELSMNLGYWDFDWITFRYRQTSLRIPDNQINWLIELIGTVEKFNSPNGRTLLQLDVKYICFIYHHRVMWKSFTSRDRPKGGIGKWGWAPAILWPAILIGRLPKPAQDHWLWLIFDFSALSIGARHSRYETLRYRTLRAHWAYCLLIFQ